MFPAQMCNADVQDMKIAMPEPMKPPKRLLVIDVLSAVMHLTVMVIFVFTNMHWLLNLVVGFGFGYTLVRMRNRWHQVGALQASYRHIMAMRKCMTTPVYNKEGDTMIFTWIVVNCPGLLDFTPNPK